MKKQILWFGLIVVALIIVSWLLNPKNAPVTNSQTISPTPNEAFQATTASSPKSPEPIPASNASNGVETNSPVGPPDLIRASQQEHITAEAALNKIVAERNLQSQDYFGRVIDQSGKPVPDATVSGTLVKLESGTNEKHEVYTVQSDEDGLFQFTELTGWQLKVVISKAGYEVGSRGEGYQGPVNRKTSPNDRAVFTMWKLRGAEPMIHDEKFYGIVPDGRVYTIDLLERKKNEGQINAGDFFVRIQRPGEISPRENFDWSFTISAINGGFVEATGGYLNEAPENGYNPEYEIKMMASDPKWQRELKKTLYLKSRGGQLYGRIHVTLIPDYRNGSVFKINSYINPAGSRNLEFSPTKQIP